MADQPPAKVEKEDQAAEKGGAHAARLQLEGNPPPPGKRDAGATSDAATPAVVGIDQAKEAIESGQPVTIKINSTNGRNEADELFKILQEKNGSVTLVKQRYEVDSYPVTEANALKLSTREGPITLKAGTALPDGSTLKSDAALPNGSIFDPATGTLRSADATAKGFQLGDTFVPNGTKVSADRVSGGQDAAPGVRINVRHTTDESGKPVLDTIPISESTFQNRWQAADNGKFVPKIVPTETTILPPNVTIESTTKHGIPIIKPGDGFRADGFGVGPKEIGETFNGYFNEHGYKFLKGLYAEHGQSDSPHAKALDQQRVKALGGEIKQLLELSIKAVDQQPVEALVQRSVSENQELFKANLEKGQVIDMAKQDFQVQARKVTAAAGETVPTKENPTGELVKQGQWVLQRLDGEGKPVVHDGKPDQWPMNEAKMLKTYNVPADVLASGKGVASVNTDAPPVHMVMLDRDTTIQTPWGSMQGSKGDMLANYDYDKATGTAGKDYAIVARRSFDETYKPTSKEGTDTLKQLRTEQSIAANQETFKTNLEKGQVLDMVKQDFQVQARKVTAAAGETVPTKENPTGELVQQGQWVLQRLDDEGKPVVHDGKPDQWPMAEAKMVKTYNVPADVLASGAGVARVNTDAPPVQMVMLDRDTTIDTPWGSMAGRKGDMLANYDYDTATGTAGKDYAIVAKRSFDETYQGATPKDAAKLAQLRLPAADGQDKVWRPGQAGDGTKNDVFRASTDTLASASSEEIASALMKLGTSGDGTKAPPPEELRRSVEEFQTKLTLDQQREALPRIREAASRGVPLATAISSLLALVIYIGKDKGSGQGLKANTFRASAS